HDVAHRTFVRSSLDRRRRSGALHGGLGASVGEFCGKRCEDMIGVVEESREKTEIRKPKPAPIKGMMETIWSFGFRICFGFRYSDVGFTALFYGCNEN